jgi:hypothetical protein
VLSIVIDIALLGGETGRVSFTELEEAMEARVNMFLCSIGEDASPVGVRGHIFDELVGCREQNEVVETSGVR